MKMIRKLRSKNYILAKRSWKRICRNNFGDEVQEIISTEDNIYEDSDDSEQMDIARTDNHAVHQPETETEGDNPVHADEQAQD